MRQQNILLVFVTVVLLVISMQRNEACRILDKEEEEKYWKPKDIVLQSLRGSVPSSGNGCRNTPNGGGNHCVTNQMNFAGRAMPPPRVYSDHVTSLGVATDRK